MELYKLSAAELAKMLREGKCTSTQILDSIYERIDAVEDKVEAFVTITKEQAYAKAKEIDEKFARGEKLHPLAGIPIAIKDNICTKDVLTTCSSKMLYNFVPPYDATVMQKLNDCGAILVGKTNMDEFAMGSSTETSYFKKTKNPRGLDRVPGGSSGGSAAAVAAGEAPISLGSDTGGSIRQPASFCGVVGLKPTYGAVSRYGLVAFASSLDQIGPFGRTVEDVAMLFSAICGRDPMDATSSKHEHEDVMAALNGDVKGLRIGIPAEYFGDGIDAEVKESVMAAVKKLEEQGAIIKGISLPSTKYALPAYYIIASAEASSNLARFDGVKYGWRAEGCGSLEELYRRTRTEGFGPEVKKRILLGTFVLSADCYDSYYKKALQARARLKAAFDAVFQRYDLLLTPVAPTTAPRLGEGLADPLSLYLSDIYTVPANLAGLPALSMPCGFDRSGLPIGAQLIGPALGDLAVLDAAHAYQQETDWHRRHPDTPATAKGGDAL